MVYPALKQVAAALALVGALGSASADTFDLGLLSTTIGKSGIEVSGSFDDIFTFTTSSTNPVEGSFVGISGANDMTVEYRFGVGAVTPIWGAFTDPMKVTLNSDGDFGYSQTVSGLQAGTKYWFNLKGTGSEAKYSVTLAPVPEPETYAMLLAGLGLIGAIARRRKTTTTKMGA